MININFNVNIVEYANNFSNISVDISNKLATGAIVCPKCRCHLIYNSTYSRHPKNADGTKIDIEIIQVLCTSCEKTHALIPDILMPYKHYSAEVIEKAVSSGINESDCVADSSTIYRWKKQFSDRGLKALQILYLILLGFYQSVMSASELDGKPLIKQLHLYIEELGVQKSTTIIGTVNVILSSADAGFI